LEVIPNIATDSENDIEVIEEEKTEAQKLR
jgi:hypothetical protein